MPAAAPLNAALSVVAQKVRSHLIGGVWRAASQRHSITASLQHDAVTARAARMQIAVDNVTLHVQQSMSTAIIITQLRLAAHFRSLSASASAISVAGSAWRPFCAQRRAALRFALPQIIECKWNY